MPSRDAHLVGSLPAPDAAAAMDQALTAVGDRLRTLPDGETGERYHWIIHIIDGMRAHPDLELRKDGDWGDYDRTPQFKERKGRRLTADALDLGYARAFEESWPAFVAARSAAGDPGLAFQAGIPGDLDMALFVLGPQGALRRRAPFTEATLREIRAIHARAGGDVVFQIEIPVELVAVAKAPEPAQPLLARVLARGVANLARRSPDGARFGVHLCLGDMNHRALGRMRDTAPLVALANAIARAWPEDRPLEYVHAPFAAAEEPPPARPSWYAPLERLRLGAGTRFVAGFAHEDQALDDQRFVRELIERSVGGAVDVSTSCGLGRRSPDAAARALARVRELTEA
jgi:hypothetical protein